MATDKTQSLSVTIRICDADTVLVVWRNSLKGNFSKIAKSILYAHQKNKPYPTFPLKPIEITKKILDTKTISISFSKNPVDIQLYEFIKGDGFSPFDDDDYLNTINTSNKVKKVLLDSIGANVINQIDMKIREYNSEVLGNTIILSDTNETVSHISENKTAATLEIKANIEPNIEPKVESKVEENAELNDTSTNVEEISINNVESSESNNIIGEIRSSSEKSNEDLSNRVKKTSNNKSSKGTRRKPHVVKHTSSEFDQDIYNEYLKKANSNE